VAWRTGPDIDHLERPGQPRNSNGGNSLRHADVPGLLISTATNGGRRSSPFVHV